VTESIAKAAEELVSLSEEMQKSASRFKIDEDEERPGESGLLPSAEEAEEEA